MGSVLVCLALSEVLNSIIVNKNKLLLLSFRTFPFRFLSFPRVAFGCLGSLCWVLAQQSPLMVANLWLATMCHDSQPSCVGDSCPLLFFFSFRADPSTPSCTPKRDILGWPDNILAARCGLSGVFIFVFFSWFFRFLAMFWSGKAFFRVLRRYRFFFKISILDPIHAQNYEFSASKKHEPWFLS